MNRHAKELQRNISINDYDYLCKCLLLGDSSVGKSSIVERYVENNYKSNFISTIGVDFKIKTIEYESKVLKLQVQQTSLQYINLGILTCDRYGTLLGRKGFALLFTDTIVVPPALFLCMTS